jgi:hypothetical protein
MSFLFALPKELILEVLSYLPPLSIEAQQSCARLKHANVRCMPNPTIPLIHTLSLPKDNQTAHYCTLFQAFIDYTAAYEHPTPKAAKPSYVFPITRLPTPTLNVVA